MISKPFLFLGAANAALAVILGAFGAHVLKTRLAPHLLEAFQTGVQYHFYHALGLCVVGLAAAYLPSGPLVKLAGWTMTAGIVLFSGSLYALSMTGKKWLGAVTPVGGVLFILCWVFLAIAVLKK